VAKDAIDTALVTLTPSGSTQSAFVFAKPHANKPAVLELILKKFAEVGIEVVSEGEIDGPTIDTKQYIDQHYYAVRACCEKRRRRHKHLCPGWSLIPPSPLRPH
jgi:hypothetical protein